MAKIAISLLMLALCWCSGLRLARAQPASPTEPEAEAKKLFLELARIAILPIAEQTRALPRFYTDILPPAYQRAYSAVSHGAFARAEAALKTEPPEAVAEEIERQGGWMDLQEAAHGLCLKILADHVKELQPMLLASLQSKKAEDRALALDLIREACKLELQKHPEIDWLKPDQSWERRREVLLRSRLQVYAEPVLHLYLTDRDSSVSSRSRYTLPALQNPHSLDTLVTCLERGEILPDLPEVLQGLCAQRSPHPKLLRALRSPNVEVRRTAATALSLSGSSLLVPTVLRLVRDPDPEVRISTAIMGQALQPADWEKVRPALLTLLEDSVPTVRGHVCGFLANAEGKKIARPLLRLIQDDALPMEAHFYVYDALRRVAGDDFGYVDGYYRNETWRPTTPANRAAIQKFAVWVEANAPEPNPQPLP